MKVYSMEKLGLEKRSYDKNTGTGSTQIKGGKKVYFNVYSHGAIIIDKEEEDDTNEILRMLGWSELKSRDKYASKEKFVLAYLQAGYTLEYTITEMVKDYDILEVASINHLLKDVKKSPDNRKIGFRVLDDGTCVYANIATGGAVRVREEFDEEKLKDLCVVLGWEIEQTEEEFVMEKLREGYTMDEIRAMQAGIKIPLDELSDVMGILSNILGGNDDN